MQKSKIEWCDYVLNPVVGCNHGCSYCYAKALNKRFKFVQVWEQPQFFPERLSRTKTIKLPKNRNRIAAQISPDKPIVFVGSMSDIMSEKVKTEWILKIINFAENHLEANFMFLTKNPSRYKHYSFPNNVYLGTSIESGFSLRRINDLYEVKHQRKFVSVEPLTGYIQEDLLIYYDKGYIDFVLVGAMTGPKATPPQPEWIDSIKHPMVYYKDNILKYLK